MNNDRRRIPTWGKTSSFFKFCIFPEMKTGIAEKLILNVHELKKPCDCYLHYSFMVLISGNRLSEREHVWRKYAWRKQALPDEKSTCKKCLLVKNVHLYFASRGSSNKKDYLCMDSRLFHQLQILILSFMVSQLFYFFHLFLLLLVCNTSMCNHKLCS